MTHFKSEAEITAIGLGLLNRTLPKPAWTHAAHFAAAIYILTRPDLDAAHDMPALIRAYNEATGVANTDTTGYHETITQASLRAASAHLTGAPLHYICNDLLNGPLANPSWLLEYWSQELLFSPPARRHWINPDREPLPYAPLTESTSF